MISYGRYSEAPNPGPRKIGPKTLRTTDSRKFAKSCLICIFSEPKKLRSFAESNGFNLVRGWKLTVAPTYQVLRINKFVIRTRPENNCREQLLLPSLITERNDLTLSEYYNFGRLRSISIITTHLKSF